MQSTPIHRFSIHTVEIKKLVNEGVGLAEINGYKVFVPGTVPGDHVKIRLKKKKKHYAVGTCLSFLTMSSLRQQSPCSSYPDCGGCQLIDLAYKKQIQLKEQIFKDCILKMAPALLPTLQSVIEAPSATFYRNKMEFSFGKEDKKIFLGLKKRGCFDKIVPTPECQLQSLGAQDILKKTGDFFSNTPLLVWDYKHHNGCLKHLMIRHSKTHDTYMLNLTVGESHPEIIKEYCNTITKVIPNIESIYLTFQNNKTGNDYINDCRHIFGKKTISETLGKHHFQISPQAFFQTNTTQAARLYNLILETAQLKPSDTLFDLYCGTGTIGLYLAEHVHQVIGIEEIESAVQDAKQNALKNAISNAHFIATRVKNYLKTNTLSPDCIIIDPPRCGMVPKALKRVIELKSPQLIYVSCNPSTLLRDLLLLCEAGYKVESIQPIDLFPNTFHIESVVKCSYSQ